MPLFDGWMLAILDAAAAAACHTGTLAHEAHRKKKKAFALATSATRNIINTVRGPVCLAIFFLFVL